MKTKSIISAIITLCVIVFIASACGKKYDCTQCQSNSKINWKTYNDVVTIYESYSGRPCCDNCVPRDMRKNIKAYGWMHPTSTDFPSTMSRYGTIIFWLMPTKDFNGFLPTISVEVCETKGDEVREAFRAKLATASATSRLFVRGKLKPIRYGHFGAPEVCFIGDVVIIIESADDVYFK